jgi:hypothetical protein
VHCILELFKSYKTIISPSPFSYFTCVHFFCSFEEIGEWIIRRRDEWNNHILRMALERLVRTVRDKPPAGRWSDILETTG